MDDDLFQQKPKTPLEEAWHNEQVRKQYDIVRVSNPRQVTVKGVVYDLPEKDFYIQYDVEQHQRIPFGTTIDIARPRAILYCTHKKNEIINFVCDKMHDEFLAERRAKGMPDYANKEEENRATYVSDPYPKTNDENIIAEIFNQLWIGIVNVASNDPLPKDLDPRRGEVDLKSGETKAIEKLQNRRIEQEDIPVMGSTPAPSPFSTMNQRLSAEDITNESN